MDAHIQTDTLTDAHAIRHTRMCVCVCVSNVIRAPLFLGLLCPVRQKTHYWLPVSLINWEHKQNRPASSSLYWDFLFNWSGAGEQHLETGSTRVSVSSGVTLGIKCPLRTFNNEWLLRLLDYRRVLTSHRTSTCVSGVHAQNSHEKRDALPPRPHCFTLTPWKSP